MTFRTLIRRSLRHHWRAHLGVTLGAAIGSAALIGALVVGDSVRGSLREHAMLRLGQTAFAVTSGDRFLPQARENLFPGVVDTVDENGKHALLETRSGGALMLPGTAARVDGLARANSVQLIGVSVRPGNVAFGYKANGFFGLAAQPSPTEISPGQVQLNSALANHLNAKLSDELIFRVEKLSGLPRDAAVSPRGPTAALRLRVAAIRSAEQLGDFSLRAAASPPLNAFVNLTDLQTTADLAGRVNVVLVPGQAGYRNQLTRLLNNLLPKSYVEDIQMIVGVNARVWNEQLRRVPDAAVYQLYARDVAHFINTLSDADLELRWLDGSKSLALVSPRVFLDPPVERAGLAAATNVQPVLTYLANLLHAGTNAAPYSMVTAAGAPWTPADLRDDEILVSQWLADDLCVKLGDEIALSYFDPESGARLVERTNTFRVRGIVPMERPWADRTLMPDFPGIEKAESTRDWDAGFPLTYKIRQKDEDYWKQFRGTPKAFVTLAAGQKMWGNRFGNVTAIRFPIPTEFVTVAHSGPDSEVMAAFRRRIPTNASSGVEIPLPSSVPSVSITGVTNQTPVEASPAPPPLRESKTYAGEYRGPADAVTYHWHLEQNILALLKPEDLGLRFEPVREQALKAAEQSQDFGGLFLGFSFFLIAAALLLMAMLFQLGLEQRAPEIGTLLALGFTPKQVRKLLLGEGVALSLLGGVLGALAGLAYAIAMLHGLATVWRDAVGAAALSFHVTPQTLAIGLFASVAVSMATIWLTLRKFVRRPAAQLLAGEIEEAESKARGSRVKVVAILALVAALALVGWMLSKSDTANAGAFFGAGALVLIAGLGFVSAWLANVLRTSCPQNHLHSFTPKPQKESALPAGRRQHVSLGSLGLRGCARRRKRSLATVAMLACGSFLIVSIGVFRLDANRDATQRTSGTGGFALIGETTMPVVQDLNSPSGRDFFALQEEDLKGVSFVPFRVREGDEASCLNLNRAQRPRLLGVRPELLAGRFGFTKGSGWQPLISTRLQPGGSAVHDAKNRLNGFLTTPPSDTGLKPGVNENEVPAIGDANSIQWAMGKKVGDTLDYVDERGQPFKVRIIGAVANSILQGQLIIDEAEFVKRFPSESGYRQFLIDAPTNRAAEVSATLSRAMQDVGLELTPAAQRLAQFNAVQNTYLGTFQVLGGLGLLLGSVGLGIVVLRNVLERRGELAVLLAVGFRKPTLQRLLLIENGALLALGLAVGCVAAAVAVLPALLSPGAQLPWLTLGPTLAAVLLNGALWTWAATRYAVRGDLLAALRNE